MRPIAYIIMLLLLAGCATAPVQHNQASSAPLNDITRPMLGQWICEGENVIRLSQDDAQIDISFQKNDTWLINISDARIVDNEIHFITKHYLRDGSHHPFNGTPCNTIIRTKDNDQLEMGMSSEHSPEYDFDTLTRRREK